MLACSVAKLEQHSPNLQIKCSSRNGKLKCACIIIIYKCKKALFWNLSDGMHSQFTDMQSHSYRLLRSSVSRRSTSHQAIPPINPIIVRFNPICKLRALKGRDQGRHLLCSKYSGSGCPNRLGPVGQPSK